MSVCATARNPEYDHRIASQHLQPPIFPQWASQPNSLPSLSHSPPRPFPAAAASLQHLALAYALGGKALPTAVSIAGGDGEHKTILHQFNLSGGSLSDAAAAHWAAAAARSAGYHQTTCGAGPARASLRLLALQSTGDAGQRTPPPPLPPT
eukprot:CAMPEP_0113690240 /NCGR_PEP_ID=MMETSP0038_2-20120614/17660_1 /TAXON_ID=2898 /ORGANISM="Cryptomonas paramecium" /LENGTH=150 /DNA_ID=CAMNT_0000611501 /DNA_START=581 /DNA_END=1030 /DNA_ORIENTATION=+ /assembly_acc=CAM_ASM_000170